MVWKTDGQDRLARSLETLIDDIDRRIPNRDRHNDGTLGDARHRALGDKTDHNPHVHLGAAGIVTALDVTHDPESGFDAGTFAESLRTEKDRRIKYVIFNGRIFSSVKEPWTWRDRNQGPGDHSEHVHISVLDDPALYDDTTPWAYDLTGGPSGPRPVFPPKLSLGDKGAAVIDLQTLLGIEADGDFGEDTDAAVRAFQQRNNLFVDGIVGSHTWAILMASTPMQPVTASGAILSTKAVEDIVDLAAGSALIKQKWSGSLAPRGYIKGMAVAFAHVYAKWKARDPAALMMAAADGGKEGTDALSWYASEFRAAGMDNSATGPQTLRHLFVLLIGLGMRESGGRYNEGRDTTASNTDADTAEAGLFQMSWNARSASAELPRLFALHSRAADDGLLSIFQEGVRARATANFGTGEGVAYQQLCKARPLFAVETAGIALRVLRRHFGPINRREAEIRPEADALLLKVQEVVDLMVLVPRPQVAPAEHIPQQPQQLPLPGSVDPMHLLLLVMAAILKDKPMQDTSGAQGQGDLLTNILSTVLRSVLSGGPIEARDLVAPSPVAPPPPPAPSAPATVGDPLAPLLPALMPMLLQALLRGLAPQSGALLSQLIVPAPQPQPTTPVAPPPAPKPALTVSPVPIALPLDAGLLKQLSDLVGALSGGATAGGDAASAERIKTTVAALLDVIGKSQKLGPVNGALGQTVGRMLDGKKSAIGIIGALASGVLEVLPQVVPALATGPVASLLPGIGGLGLPVFLAMTAWGFLGKMEKWTGAAQQARTG